MLRSRYRGSEGVVIRPMCVRDPRRDLGVREASAPELTRRTRPAWYEAKAAADLCAFVMARHTGCSLVDARVAFVLTAVEIDPGAGDLLDQHKLVTPGGPCHAVDVAVLQRSQGCNGHSQGGPQRQRVIPPRTGDGFREPRKTATAT